MNSGAPVQTAAAPGVDARAVAVAAELTGALWGLVRLAGGPRREADQHTHFAGVFEPRWLFRLGLPTCEVRPVAQRVALTRELSYDRFVDRAALERAYRVRARTRVYENLHRDGGCPWLLLTAHYLTVLSGDDAEVICSLYESVSADANLGRHRDMWYGVMVQLGGAKRWELGPGVLDDSEPKHTVLVQAGDVLLVPEGVPHLVSTPKEPGYSRHLQFALCRRLEGEQVEPTLLP